MAWNRDQIAAMSSERLGEVESRARDYQVFFQKNHSVYDRDKALDSLRRLLYIVQEERRSRREWE